MEKDNVKTVDYQGKKVQVMDCTPTWEGLVNYMAAVIRDGSPESQKDIMSELRRMAQLADSYSAILKKKESESNNITISFDLDNSDESERLKLQASIINVLPIDKIKNLSLNDRFEYSDAMKDTIKSEAIKLLGKGADVIEWGDPTEWQKQQREDRKID